MRMSLRKMNRLSRLHASIRGAGLPVSDGIAWAIIPTPAIVVLSPVYIAKRMIEYIADVSSYTNIPGTPTEQLDPNDHIM